MLAGCTAAHALEGDQPIVEHAARDNHRPRLQVSPYFRRKARIEFPIAIALVSLASPFWLVASLLALIDVGPPILFWQHRPGFCGRVFQLYKIRTLRAAFDRDGNKVPEDKRLSVIGRFLRRTRFDELPQLLNVLVGEMSLIGPRPLLVEDQPTNSDIRLAVRPGITGWAQVNGGVLLSSEEKDELDAWYIRNASGWLDLKIIAMTLRSLFFGDRRSENAIALALGSDRWRTQPEPILNRQGKRPVSAGAGD